MKTHKTNWWATGIFAFLCLGVGPLRGHGSTLDSSADLKPITVNDTQEPIRIDAYLVDWPVSRMIVLNQKSQVTYGQLNWKGKNVFSGRVFITYDSQYLYLSAIVQKTSPVVNNNSGMSLWAGDCLELYLSAYTIGNHPTRLSKADYHIGFSPGTNCDNPQMFCFNKEESIGGGRVAARSTGHGYILEACIPLSYFEGLEIAPGLTTRFNLALDEGGTSSNNRILQLDLTGNSQSWENPSLWRSIQWIGKTTVSIPEGETQNLYADLVMDGTLGAVYWGHRNITGTVLDQAGKPISGAVVTTWPRTQTVTAASDGSFELDDVKVYDQSVIYARMDGYATSLAPVNRDMSPVTVHLTLLPAFLTSNDIAGSGFYGQSIRVPDDGRLGDLLTRIQDWVKPLNLKFLKLVGTRRLLTQKLPDQYAALDQFIRYARQWGAEPMIELPIIRDDPTLIADWVHHCNIDEKEQVIYWTVGNEPDLYSAQRPQTEFSDYNVYNYINDFRIIYNSVKKVDPSVLILGPELAWRYTSMEDDWLTPFVQFDGDIVNLVSIHHYGSLMGIQCNPTFVMNDVLHMQTLLRGLENRIAVNSDIFLPLVITGGNICLEPTGNTSNSQIAWTPKSAFWESNGNPTPVPSPETPPASKLLKSIPPKKVDAGPDSFWAALWAADQAGTLMNNHIPMAIFSYLSGDGELNFLSSSGGKPIYWVLRLMSTYMKGNIIWAQVQNNNVLVYAVQNPQTKDVTLMLLNKGGDYYHPKILLNASPADVSVDAHLNQTFDYEIPFYSIAFLVIKADRSGDQAILYTQKMAQAGTPPIVTNLKPW